MTRRKPRRGPLPGTTGAGRTAVLRVRVSPEEHAAYVADAERAGVPLSEWVREQLSFARLAGKSARYVIDDAIGEAP